MGCTDFDTGTDLLQGAAAGIWSHKQLHRGFSPFCATVQLSALLQVLTKAQDTPHLSQFCRWVGQSETFQDSHGAA